MIGAIESLATLAGDALSAVGAKLRTRREGFSDYEAGDYLLSSAFEKCEAIRADMAGRMESDGPDQTWPQTWPIPQPDVREALDELPDSKLLNLAATILVGTARCLTDVDVLVDVLRDRAAQFAAIEAPLGAHLTDSTRRGE